VVTEWVEPERFAYRAVSGWEMEAVNALAPEDGGTRIAFTLRYRLPDVWGGLIPRPLVRLAFANLRRRVEPGEPGASDDVALLRFTVDIAAPPTEVFWVVGNPRSKLVWVPAIKRIQTLSGEAPGPGSRYLASSGIGGVECAFQEEISEWQPPHRLAYRGTSRWGRFLATWEIEPAPDGSRACYRMGYRFPGGRLGRAAGRLAAAVVGPPLSRTTAAKAKEVVEEHKWVEPEGLETGVGSRGRLHDLDRRIWRTVNRLGWGRL
jgi:uncharacterized protein YndB with AHSA1/START domain